MPSTQPVAPSTQAGALEPIGLPFLRTPRSVVLPQVALAAAGLAGLARISFHAHATFHLVNDLATVVVSWAVLLLAIATRPFARDDALLILGAFYGLVGVVDFGHVLTVEGLIEPDPAAGSALNLAAQLWLAARGLEAAGLFAFATLHGRRVPDAAVVGIGAVLAVAAAGAYHLWHLVPDGLAPGGAATTFLRGAVLTTATVVAMAAALLYRARTALAPRVALLLLLAMAATILSSLALAGAVMPGDGIGVASHLLKAMSMLLVAAALMQAGVSQPFALICRRLSGSQDRLAHEQTLDRLWTRLRHAVVPAREGDQLTTALPVLRQGLLDLDLPILGCALTLVDDSTSPPVIIAHSVCCGSQEPSGEAAPTAAVLPTWARGRPVHWDLSERNAPPLPVPRASLEEHGVRCVLSVPLAQGLLTVCSAHPQAFSSARVDLVSRVAAVLERALGARAGARGVELHQRAAAEGGRRLHTLMTNLPGMVCRRRVRPAGRPLLEFASDGALALTGHDAAALRGGAPDYGDLVVAEDRAAVVRAIDDAVAADCPYEVEYRIRRRNGETRWVWERGQAVAGEAAHLESFVTDVSERRRTVDALAVSEARCRSLMDHTRETIVLLDLAVPIDVSLPVEDQVRRFAAEARVTACNDAAARILGTDEARVGRRLREVGAGLLDNDHLARFVAAGYELRDDLVADGQRWFLRTTAGVVEAGRLVRAAITQTEVTRLREQETQIRLLAASVEQAGEIVIITDTQPTILYTNPAFEAITGYGRAEALGRNPSLLSGTHDMAFVRELWKTLRAGHTWQGRIVSRRKDGSPFTKDGTITPVRDDRGRVVNYVAVMRDVTRELEVEARSQEAQRMESLGALAGGVAHDLNNMLAPVLLESDRLLTDLAGGDPRHERLRNIHDSALKARDLVRQLLLFGRRSTTDLTRLDLVAVVRGLERLLRTSLRDGVHLSLGVLEEPLPVRGDRGQLEQVAMNLVLNAQDAMPEGGRVRVLLARGQADADADLVTPAVAGDCVVLTVEDTGTGMDEATRQRIFEPFFSTKGSNGTGLGLATTYSVIAAHGGAIGVASTRGTGTCFRVYLPLCAGDARTMPAAEAPPVPADTQATGGRRILVVEDDEDIRGVVTRVLQDFGYRTLAAGSVAAAAAAIAAGQIVPDLVLTDLVLPDGTGRDVAAQTAGLQPAPRLLFMSGHGRDEALESGILRAADPLLTKCSGPFSA